MNTTKLAFVGIISVIVIFSIGIFIYGISVKNTEIRLREGINKKK